MSLILKYAVTPALLLVVFGLCLAMGPKRPATLNHIADRFAAVDWSALPDVLTITARDGEALAYRVYGNGPEVVLALHGSGGSGRALHPLADMLSSAERTIIVPDIRGHGATGVLGDVAYVGQVTDDLDDLLKAVAPDAPLTVVGFSMGGGIALSYTAARPKTVERAVLLSPYLAFDAPPMAAENPFAPATEWASAAVPRIVTLGMLNSVGITAFNHLDVAALATRPEDSDRIVSAYTYRALNSYNPADWQADMAAAAARITLIVGAEDELHAAPGYAEALADQPDATLITLPGVDHMGLTLEPSAIKAVTKIFNAA